MSQHEAPSSRGPIRHLLGHLLVPLYLALGMSLGYLGGFHQAQPHNLPVAVVGQDAGTSVLATQVADAAGSQLSVRTAPTEAAARAAVTAGNLDAAYLPSSSTVIVDGARSPSVAQVAQTVFGKVAAATDQPLRVDDVAPLPAGDAVGTNLFFLLVALTVGAYTCAATLGVAGAAAGVRFRDRTALGLGVAGVIAGIGTVVAGPVIGAVHGHLPEVFLLAWLYVAGVVVLGSSLHTFVGRWATPLLVTMFVMLNFTSSGGVYDARLQGGVFATLSSFWNGSAFLRAARSLVYGLPGGIGGDVGVLISWLAVGFAAVLSAASLTAARARHARREELAVAAPAVPAPAVTVPAVTVPAVPSPVTPAEREPAATREDEELEEGVAA